MAVRRQEQKEESLLRLLRYALGARPDEFGLVPDQGGWVPIKELVKALHDEEQWRFVRESTVQEAATRLAPQDLESDGRLVRARERRPLERDYAADPPGHLYYGARRRAWPVMRERGLAAQPGQVLILVADPDHAQRLGRRRDQEAVLITIQARKAQERGVMFSLLGEKLWLCDQVPADFLLGPPVPENLPQKKPPKAKPPALPAWQSAPPTPESMPGSFLVNSEDAAKPYKRKGIKKDIGWKKERHKDKRRKDEE